MKTTDVTWREIQPEKIIKLFCEPFHPHDLLDPFRIADELGIQHHHVDFLPVSQVIADLKCGERLLLNGKRVFYMNAVSGGDLIDAIAAGFSIKSTVDAGGNYVHERINLADEIVRRLKAR